MSTAENTNLKPSQMSNLVDIQITSCKDLKEIESKVRSLGISLDKMIQKRSFREALIKRLANTPLNQLSKEFNVMLEMVSLGRIQTMQLIAGHINDRIITNGYA